MTTNNQPSIRVIYDAYRNGDVITDRNLIFAYKFFKGLADDLVKCGPVFSLAFQEAYRTERGLKDIIFARNLDIDK